MIVVMDSGIGGKKIEENIRKLLPRVKVTYFKDSKNFPYGNKKNQEIKNIITKNCEKIVKKGANIIVLACNTASVVSLDDLRRKFRINFVGVVPAVKRAAKLSRTKTIAVFGTRATSESKMLADLIEEFCQGIKVYKISFDDLAFVIEAGNIDQARDMVRRKWQKYQNQNIDCVVLGCTHYTLIKDEIQRIVGPKVQVIDSNLAVARQVKKIYQSIQTKL